MARIVTTPSELPARIGSAEFSTLGSMVAVRCPSDLGPLMRKAGGLWEPGGRRWLIERRRIGPLIRSLRRATDPLFRHAGIDLDEEGRGSSDRLLANAIEEAGIERSKA